MNVNQHRIWDRAIKAGGFLGLIASETVGVYQYQDLRHRQIDQFPDMKEREFYAQFWNERLRLYIKTLDAAAKISTSKSDEDPEVAIRQFRNLFDGPMAVVQDFAVDSAMHDFNEQVQRVENGEMDRQDLGIHSYTLGRICFNSLRTSWNTPFSKLGTGPDSVEQEP